MLTQVRASLRSFLELIARDTITFTEHAGRKTCVAADVAHALKRNGRRALSWAVKHCRPVSCCTENRD